jgi:mannitol-1-phosphate/altronate dehydrogenase
MSRYENIITNISFGSLMIDAIVPTATQIKTENFADHIIKIWVVPLNK